MHRHFVLGFLFALLGDAAFAQKSVPNAGVPDTIAQRALACVACHGPQDRNSAQGYFPRIAGKPADYLYKQLLNFRDGRRRHASMTYMVANMSDDYLRELAHYFAGLQPSYPPPEVPAEAPTVLERGRSLAMTGDKSKNIPACISCHGERLTGLSPAIPGLLGLPRYYLVAQFGAWQSGVRMAGAPDCMAQITRQLSPADIAAVSAWLASQPVPKDSAPAPAGSLRLPLPCGGVPQ